MNRKMLILAKVCVKSLVSDIIDMFCFLYKGTIDIYSERKRKYFVKFILTNTDNFPLFIYFCLKIIMFHNRRMG